MIDFLSKYFKITPKDEIQKQWESFAYFDKVGFPIDTFIEIQKYMNQFEQMITGNEIDNFDKIKPLLTFESEDDFYYLQILQRKKENTNIGANSRVIKNYYIGSIEYLEKHYEEIKTLCRVFNARAMLRLNKRSYRKVAFKALQNMANTMSNQEYQFVRKSYDRAVGQGHNDKNKKWIIDIDEKWPEEQIEKFKKELVKYKPVGEKIYVILPTKNGLHFITKPFDLKHFKTNFPDIVIQKDNPTNLFIP